MEDVFFKNPWVRAFLPLILLGASSMFASSLVVEIANGNNIEWNLILSKVSFYLLIICTGLLCSYQVMISRHDQALIKGITPKQFEATMRYKVTEESAKRVRKLIKDGDVEKLEKETETFKKLFGEGSQ
jgi:hypothetical protein